MRYIMWGLGLVIILILALIPFAYDIFPFLTDLIDINDYTLRILISGFYFAMLASSWSLLMGYGGQFSFAHLAFAGVGAYTTGLLGRYLGHYAFVSPLSGIIAGTLMAGLFGLVIGSLVLRLRKTYLALFTIAFAEILRLVISAEKDFTAGPNGLPVGPLFPEGIGPFSKVDVIPPYFVMFILLLASLAFMSWLAASRFGLFLRAIREDEEAAAAMGVNVIRYKVLVFVVTSMVAGLAGAVRAHYVGVIAPNDMVILWMSLVITMAVLGGIESLTASAIGGIIVIWSLEYLRANFATTSVMIVVLTVILTVILYFLGRYAAKKFMDITLKGPRNVITLVIFFILSLLIAIPVTTGISYAFYDISGGILLSEVKVDMSQWRMVFFGLVLMLTLRFAQNGLLYPIIQYFFSPGDLADTVAKRDAAEQIEAEASS